MVLIDIVWSSGSNLLVVIVRFGSFVMLGRRLGPVEYGAYVGMYGFLNPVGSLAFTGISLAVLQRAIRDEDALNAIAAKYLALTTVQGAAGLAAALILASIFLDGVNVVTVGIFGIVELLILASVEVAASIVQAASTFPAATRVRIGTQLVRTGTLAVLFFTHSLTLGALAVALLISTSAYLAYLLAVLLPRAGVPIGLSRPRMRDVIVAAQLSFTLFSSSVKEDGDKAVLAANGLERVTGIYGAGYRVLQLGSVPLRAIESAVFYRFLSTGAADPGSQMGYALRYTAAIFAVSAAVGVGLFAASPHLGLLLGESFVEAEEVVRFLSPVLPLLALSQGPSNGLAGLGRLALRGAVVGGAAVLSLLLYIALVPPLGWQGAAIGTLAGEAALAIALWIVFIHAYREAQIEETPLDPGARR